jgi:hypothetical protein
VDRRPKGPNRDAELNAGASSGSCGRSSERWAARKSRRVRTGAGGFHSLRRRDVRIRSGTGRRPGGCVPRTSVSSMGRSTRDVNPEASNGLSSPSFPGAAIAPTSKRRSAPDNTSS